MLVVLFGGQLHLLCRSVRPDVEDCVLHAADKGLVVGPDHGVNHFGVNKLFDFQAGQNGQLSGGEGAERYSFPFCGAT